MSSEQFAVPQSDGLLYMSAGFLGTIFAVILGFAFKFWWDEKQAKRRADLAAELGGDIGRLIGGPPNRARDRNRNAEAEEEEAEEDDEPAYYDEDAEDDDVPRDQFGKKIGKKKLAKLQAKQEARAAREAMMAEREEKKKKEEEERKAREEADRLEQEQLRKEAEERKKAAEEKAAREHEEYLKLKEAFAVEEEGFDELAEADRADLKQQFVAHCRRNKVVHLDDLASLFKLRVADVHDRLQALIQAGDLSGVVDDRGKFIYITDAEFDAVARFIRQRGRVSLNDLVDYSNRLISLKPTVPEVGS